MRLPAVARGRSMRKQLPPCRRERSSTRPPSSVASRDDGQAQAEALAMVAFGVADLEEFVEDPRLVHRRDADAVVAHFDADALAAHPRRQQHAAAGRGRVDRVVQQPAQQARQQARDRW
jgi:uncharacterized iron-regulated protein